MYPSKVIAGLCRLIFELVGHMFPVAKVNNEKGKNENKLFFLQIVTKHLYLHFG